MSRTSSQLLVLTSVMTIVGCATYDQGPPVSRLPPEQLDPVPSARYTSYYDDFYKEQVRIVFLTRFPSHDFLEWHSSIFYLDLRALTVTLRNDDETFGGALTCTLVQEVGLVGDIGYPNLARVEVSTDSGVLNLPDIGAQQRDTETYVYSKRGIFGTRFVEQSVFWLTPETVAVIANSHSLVFRFTLANGMQYDCRPMPNAVESVRYLVEQFTSETGSDFFTDTRN